MKILCVICHDLLIPSEDISFIRCGHVFHHHCLLQWLERSQTCPQCRDRATESRIHKAHFTFSNTEISTDNANNSSLQGKIDNLQFQILLNEKNIKHYTSKNAILEKQNAGLRQEVRKVESEINQKNSAIYALKEQIKYFKSKSHLAYDDLKKKLSQKEREMLELREVTLRKTKKIENLQCLLARQRESLREERSKRLDVEVRSKATCESGNISLQLRVNELERLLKTTLDQNCTDSSIQRKSNENSLISIQPVDINTQETADKNGPSSSEKEVEIITIADQDSMNNSTFDECPTITKKARLCLQSGNSRDKPSNDHYLMYNELLRISRTQQDHNQEKC
ncbi:E3 ubiquitin-protein ligase TRAIP isoform X2 [Solenopsis invicta]|uniref:E3 ubiquitin-protein ligase TRAIP isoform X2 n=1 Tax=Solenopsis invicta TaxID=13686 RepID=UPI000595FBE6|nr:E3 ubiquitin-protein ligase TRAIP isoform X2 [Solenopsis invicta]